MKINLLCIILIVLYSCSNPTKQDEVDFSTTEDFQLQNNDELSSLKRKRDRDVVKHLYEEALEQDSNLKSLENQILGINGLAREGLEGYTEYLNYNKLYYQSAARHLNSIQDSTKRKYFQSFINASQEQFDLIMSEHNNLIKTKSELIAELHDQHTIMKLVVSEKLINAYQNNKPSTAPIETLNEKIKKLIRETEKYTVAKK